MFVWFIFVVTVLTMKFSFLSLLLFSICVSLYSIVTYVQHLKGAFFIQEEKGISEYMHGH